MAQNMLSRSASSLLRRLCTSPPSMSSVLLTRGMAQEAATSTKTTEVSKKMKFTFASPSKVFYDNDTEVKQVDVPCINDVMGICPNHVPLLAVLKPGLVNVLHESGESKKFLISSGSVTVNFDNTVQLLVEEAYTLDEFDKSQAQKLMEEGNANLNKAKDDYEKAVAQIQIETADVVLKSI